jgi:Leucine-rich repeat (LRR) protein
MSINEYLNNLPDNVEKIDLSNKNLAELPDLFRFHNLNELNCENNGITIIPIFSNLKILYCSYNFIVSFSILPNVEILHCCSNRLTSLPIFPNLRILDCQGNRLTSLPIYPNLISLQCCNNQITIIPSFSNLKELNCSNNKTISIIMPRNLEKLQCYHTQIMYFIGNIHPIQNLRILNNFRYLYYLLKLKKKFRDWLWIKVREPKIKEEYSVSNLLKLLEGKKDEELEGLLDTW